MILLHMTELFFQKEKLEVFLCQSKPERANIHIKEQRRDRWEVLRHITLKVATNQVVILKLFK